MTRYSSERALDFAALRGGEALVSLKKHPTALGTTLFCAAIRNFHRLHFDAGFAQDQGFQGLLVPGFLTGNWCVEAATRSFAPTLRVARLRFRNTKTAYIGTPYEVTGQVVEVQTAQGQVIRADCQLAVRVPDGAPVTEADLALVPQDTPAQLTLDPMSDE